jgi:TldD protein
MPVTRRDLLKAGALAAAAAAVPRPLLAQLGRRPEPLPPIEDPRLQPLAIRALESARAAGAAYADVRLTHTRQRSFYPLFTYDEESMEVGVRALVNGYWGFASGPVWAPAEMVRLGREAVHQAKVNALGKPRVVELAPVPVVASGHWETPVAIDPFEISPFQVQDFLSSLDLYARRTPNVGTQGNRAAATVQAKVFASTLGSYCTQRCYLMEGVLAVVLEFPKKQRSGQFAMDVLSPAGMGWELYAAERIPRVREHSLWEEVRRGIEEAKEDLFLPVKPVPVGRFDTVFDARAVAGLVDETLGRATELDRALGYEANADGTSYLDDPFGMIGSYEAGASLLTLTAGRSERGGAATVKWDDEGVEPDTFPLVKDGVLADFQTTRESAGWLKEIYAKRGAPFRSHGCALAPSALDAPLQQSPNLTLKPGRDGESFDALVSDMEKGVAIKGAQLEMDFQNSSGLGTGAVFEVRNGKRVARLASAGFLFRATDLWKSVQRVGAEASLRRYGMLTAKGEPAQRCNHSVTAAPVVVRDLTIIDPLRKA